jgi:uncharacterized membrane protein (DUF4010 family)
VNINLVGLLVAALGGAAVGLERERSAHASGRDARFAGIRTFTMLGGIGGLSGALWIGGAGAPATLLVAAALAITAVAYIRSSRLDVDGTTEVAAVVVVAAGLIAGIGNYRVASGVMALTCLLLIEKSRLHALAARIDDVGLRAGVRFAVLALVVLPLLPEGPFGPLGGIRPRQLWALVLFFSALSFLAYIARRVVGPGRGYLVAGLIGGLASSTSVTFAYARASRAGNPHDRAAGYGAVAANAMLYPRVLIAIAVLNFSLLPAVAAYLAAPGLVAAAITAIGFRRAAATRAHVTDARNPLELGAALQMALMFQVVLMVVYVARHSWGQSGIWTTAAVLGLTDVDALTVSMARGMAGSIPVQVAAVAIAIGVASNTVLKLMVALILGSGGFRKIAGGALVLMTLAAAGSLALFGYARP